MAKLREKLQLLKLAELTMTNIAGIVTSFFAILGTLYAIFVFYYQAQEAHGLTIAHKKTIMVLEQDLKNAKDETKALNIQIKLLKGLYEKERDTKEFYSMRNRLNELADWERIRYCELFDKLKQGDECDAP